MAMHATPQCGGDAAQEQEQERIHRFLRGVRHKLLVMSGKGGVGKSTVAAGLAVNLSSRGFKTGLLDIDMHGPSIAGLFGLTGVPLNIVGGAIQPYQYQENLAIVSMQGFLPQPDDAVIWRGPLKIGAINQLLGDTQWGDLDFLIIDSPPGTGDEPLTIAQTIPDCQAVVVTTPQEVALADVRKSLRFCQAVNMKVLGIVENMSGFKCPTCGTVHAIFKSGGGEETARQWHYPFLGRIPLDPDMVAAADQGRVAESAGPDNEPMRAVVDNMLEILGERKNTK